MGGFTTKYTQTQRKAVEHAYCTLAIRPVAAIKRLAEAGELTYEGNVVPAFEIPYASVRDIGSSEERRRQGRAHTTLANKPHHDAIEIIRRRLINLLDIETQRLEKAQRKNKRAALDHQELYRAGRALRELAALPAPGERGRTPGRPIAGEGVPAGEGKESHASSLAGSIVAAMQPPRINTPQDGEPRQDNPRHNTSLSETTLAENTTTRDNATTDDLENGDPGDYARSQIQGLMVRDISVSQ